MQLEPGLWPTIRQLITLSALRHQTFRGDSSPPLNFGGGVSETPCFAVFSENLGGGPQKTLQNKGFRTLCPQNLGGVNCHPWKFGGGGLTGKAFIV